MPLTDNELDNLEAAAYLCDGEPFRYFEQNALPRLATLSVGELWALSGKFLDREMLEIARFIAAYARATGLAEGVDGNPRPDPRLFLRRMKAAEADYEESTLELPF